MKKVFESKSSLIGIVLLLGGIYAVIVPTQFLAGYSMHAKKSEYIINHPELLPSAEGLRIMSVGQLTTFVGFTWLTTVQYIGGNAAGAEYKEYLMTYLTTITDALPRFTEAYKLGLLLLSVDQPTKPKDIAITQQVAALGERGIGRTCDKKKIDLLLTTKQVTKLYENPLLAEPCLDGFLPYYLAYTQYWGLNNPQRASENYVVTAAHKDAPRGSEILSAIMKGKGGGRKEAIYMYLSMGETLAGTGATNCGIFTKKLSEFITPYVTGTGAIQEKFLVEVERYRQAIVAELQEKFSYSTESNPELYCSNYLNKSVREMNLSFLEEADARYKKNHNGESAHYPEVLKDAGYIRYLPQDFQRDTEKNNEIRYRYDEERKRWDVRLSIIGRQD